MGYFRLVFDAFTRRCNVSCRQYVLDMADDEDVVTFTLKQDDVALQRQLGQGHTSIGFYVMKVCPLAECEAFIMS